MVKQHTLQRLNPCLSVAFIRCEIGAYRFVTSLPSTSLEIHVSRSSVRTTRCLLFFLSIERRAVGPATKLFALHSAARTCFNNIESIPLPAASRERATSRLHTRPRIS
jgi:hypothetical protein